MKSILVSASLFVCLCIQAQTKDKVLLGTADSVYSNILHETREVWVHVPDDGPDPDGNVFAKQRFPVIYLLDGWEPNFSVVTSIAEQLGEGGGNLAFPEMIVVGIPNTDRTRDLTPTHIASGPMMDSMAAATSGGGEKFISFLENELMPHIDSVYPTAPYRILIGHSLGGLMAVYTMVHHAGLFNAYVAIDPSIIWDNKILLKQAEEAIAKNQFKNNSLFLAIANSMNSGIDTSVIGDFMRTNFRLRSDFNEYHGDKLAFSSRYYADYDHGSVPIIAEYDALRSIFNFYNFNFPYGQFFSPSFTADTLLGAHYNDISRRMGYKVSPPEQFVNALGFQLLGMKEYERARYFFKMNIDNYPGSFNAYNSMGALYEAKGDRQKAVEYYARALSLHEWPEIRKKMEKLKAGK